MVHVVVKETTLRSGLRFEIYLSKTLQRRSEGDQPVKLTDVVMYTFVSLQKHTVRCAQGTLSSVLLELETSFELLSRIL